MLGNAFELLVQDLLALREKREKRQERPVPVPRPSRPSRPSTPSRQVMSKALSTPRPAHRWNAIQRQQMRLTKAMPPIATVTPADRARALFRVLDGAAKAGRLNAIDAAKVDALRHRSGLFS